MAFHAKFRPGDLVRDRTTRDEGIITKVDVVWIDKYGSRTKLPCQERRPYGSKYHTGEYAIYPKTKGGSLNGSWYDESQLELVEKGALH